MKVPVAFERVKTTILQSDGFVPELPHSEVEFDGVEVRSEALLPGDAYATYVPSFRTLEDIYVSAATLAYLAREARLRSWPQAFVARVIAAMAALQSLVGQAPNNPSTHITLTGALLWVDGLRSEVDALWADTHDEAAVRWRRDSGLFGIAQKTRTARGERAWSSLANLVGNRSRPHQRASLGRGYGQ